MKRALRLVVFTATSLLFGCGNPDTEGLGGSDSSVDADADGWMLDTLVAETVAPDSPAADTEAGSCVLAARCTKENELCGSHLVCKCGILAPFEYAERAVCPPSPDGGSEASVDAAPDSGPASDASAPDAGAVCAAFGPCPFPGWTCTTPSGLALTCAACKVWLTPGFMCPPAPPADAGADAREAAPGETSAAESGSPGDTGLATADTAPVDTGAVDTGSVGDTGSTADTAVVADSGGVDTGSSDDTNPGDTRVADAETGATDTGSPADTGITADATTDTVADTASADAGSSADTGASDTATDTVADTASDFITLIFSWTPPTGYTQVGPVRVVGGYPGGPAWDTLCTMSASGSTYSCPLSLTKGVTATFVVEHADEKLPAKKGWVFDRGCYPGGGCGTDFGTFTIKRTTGVDHPFTLKWNGYPPAPPSAITFNGEVTVS